MNNLLKITAVILVLAAASTAGYAMFSRAEDAIRYRKAVMLLIGQHFGHMGAVVKGQKPYDKDAFARETAILKTLSNMPWEAFAYPESDRGQTNLKSNALKNKDDFMKSARNMETEVEKLVADAQTGDLNSLKKQFGAAAMTCKDCHEKFKSR
jgi:cytochrome c556